MRAYVDSEADLEPVPVDPGEGDGGEGVEGEVGRGREIAPGQPAHLKCSTEVMGALRRAREKLVSVHKN